MIVGEVIGQVWATRKDETLVGLRFVLVRPLAVTSGGAELRAAGEVLVAADPLGAGPGEQVLVAMGRAARNVIGRGQGIAYQTAIVAIVDEIQISRADRRATQGNS